MAHTVKAVILGAGSMGTAMACVLDATGHKVVLWDRDETVINGINKKHKNLRSLTTVLLPARVTAESDMAKALIGADIVVFAVASHALRTVATMARLHIEKNTVLISVTKGIEESSLLTATHVLDDVLGAKYRNQIVVFSGPTFALELATKKTTAAMLASLRANAYSERARVALSAPWVRIYQTRDIIGVELSGVAKHVIALTAGIMQGLGFGDNARAWILTESFRELSRVVWKLGGHEETVYGLAGVGDALGASFAAESRNRAFGELIARGSTVAQAREKIGQTIEGEIAVQVLYALAKKEKLQLPVLTAVHSVLFGKKQARTVFEVLLQMI